MGTGRAHATNLTHAEAIYLNAIVEDLTQQAILLEYAWAGEVSEAKMAILEEGEVETYEDRYGSQMINAGKAGSIYVTYQEVAEEIIAGAIDIAGEVADLKLGNPYISSTPEERDTRVLWCTNRRLLDFQLCVSSGCRIRRERAQSHRRRYRCD